METLELKITKVAMLQKNISEPKKNISDQEKIIDPLLTVAATASVAVVLVSEAKMITNPKPK
jgi:hypothetical protein